MTFISLRTYQTEKQRWQVKIDNQTSLLKEKNLEPLVKEVAFQFEDSDSVKGASLILGSLPGSKVDVHL